MCKNEAFVMNAKDTIFGTVVEKKFTELSEAVSPLHIHIKVLTTVMMIF